MADSALTTIAERQSVGAHHRIGMRRDALLLPLPSAAAFAAATLLLLFINTTTAFDSPQVRRLTVCVTIFRSF